MAKIQIDPTPGQTGAGSVPLNLCRNGVIPSAEGVLALADTLNYLTTRGQTIACHTSAVSEVLSFDTANNGDQAGWKFAFRTSKNARRLRCIFVCFPAASNGTTTDAEIYFNLRTGLTNAVESSVNQAALKNAGRVLAAAQTADFGFVQAQEFAVSGDTDYRLCLHLVNRAAVCSVTVFETPQNVGDTADLSLVNTALISAHAPILTTTMYEMQRVARDIWQRPKMLMSFSAEHGISGGAAGGTDGGMRNMLDTTFGAASAGSPGSIVDLSRDGTLSDTSVPVTFAINACYISSASAGRFELRDQSDAVICQIQVPTLLVGSSGSELATSWYTASGKLSTSTTKLDVFYRRDSGAGTVSITAAQVFRQHPIHPREDMTGLVAWYDASQITGLAGGAAVTTWTDQSGNGNTLTMTGSPTYQTAVVGGLPIVRFNGTTQYGFNADGGSASYRVGDLTFYTVCKFDAAPVGTAQCVAGYGHSFVASGSRWRWGWRAGATSLTLMQNNTDFGTAYAPPTTGGLLSPQVHSYTTSNRILGLGTNVVADETDGATITYPSTVGLYVATDNAFSPTLFDGDIAEILIFSGTHTVSQRRAVEHYLACKWGLSTVVLT
jgi:hypothetical protein